MVAGAHLDGEAPAGKRLDLVGVRPYPALVRAVVRVIPRKQLRQHRLALDEVLLHAVQLFLGKMERLPLVLVEDQVGLVLAQQVDAPAEAQPCAEKIAVAGGVVVHAGWGEGIPAEKDRHAVPAGKQAAVVETLPGEVQRGQLELVPAPGLAVRGGACHRRDGG